MSIKGMTAIWEYADQEGSALLLLLALADFANDEGVCWPAVGTLAKKIRLKKRQTQNLLEKLVKDGSVERLDMGGGKGKASTYRVHWPAPIENETVHSPAQRVQPSTDTMQSSVSKGAIAIAPESLEPSLNQSSEEPYYSELVKIWEKSASPITPGIAEDLGDLADECEAHRKKLPSGATGADLAGYQWVIHAIETARRATNGFNVKYVQKILDRWRRDGFDAQLATVELTSEDYMAGANAEYWND